MFAPSCVQHANKAGAVIGDGASKAAAAVVPTLALVGTTVIEGSKTAATTVASVTQNTIKDLNSVPTEILCSGCQAELKVPSTVFDWICINEHTVPDGAASCEQCGDAKPIGMASSKPSVICPTCSTSTVVPLTKAKLKLLSAPSTTKNFFVDTSKRISLSVESLSAAPTEFNCRNCHSLLHVPVGPWDCQTCAATNPEADQVRPVFSL